MPTEAAEKAFAFTAQPAPDLGASHLAARPQKRQRRQSSFPAQPFQLSTEVCPIQLHRSGAMLCGLWHVL